MKTTRWGVAPAKLGEQFKEQGMARTLLDAEREEWKACAESKVRAFKGQTVAWDRIRAFIVQHCGEPYHPNCWGALTNRLLKKGVLEDTALTKNSSIPASHARRLRVFSVL